MSLKSGQRLAMEILRELIRHWRDHSEPMGARELQNRFSNHYGKLGLEVFFTTYMERLAEAGLFYIIRTRRGRRWVFVNDVWESFSESERSNWMRRCEDYNDPIYSGLLKAR